MPTSVIVVVGIVITEPENARVQPVKLGIAVNMVCLENSDFISFNRTVLMLNSAEHEI